MPRPVRSVVTALRRGQALALGAVSLLVLALMLMLSFNLSQALHAKIQLQQHSDALAFSMATVEARALNYAAYSNRAIAASFVAITHLHAYQAAASVNADVLWAARQNFVEIGALEIAQCVACCPACCVVHCADAEEAFRISEAFASRADDYARAASDREGEFDRAVEAFVDMADLVHRSQNAVLEDAARTLRGEGLLALRARNAPRARDLEAFPEVGALNVDELACALEGATLECAGPDHPTELDRRRRSQTLAAVINASRRPFATERTTASFPTHLHPDFLRELLSDIQKEDVSLPTDHQGTAKCQASAEAGGLHDGSATEGKAIVADEHGTLISTWRHGVGASPYRVRIASEERGGEHAGRWTSAFHDGDHDRFAGLQRSSPCFAQGNCFLNFRASSDSQRDFNQPRVYAYATQDLGLRTDGSRGPWELSGEGRVSVEPAILQLSAGQGRAVSKALVYYHRLGNWNEHPNLFNPFWRAKLHPFQANEVRRVLHAAHDSDLALTEEAPVDGSPKELAP